MAKERERIELLAACARNYLYMYGELQSVIINASDLEPKERAYLINDNMAFLERQEKFIQMIEKGK